MKAEIKTDPQITITLTYAEATVLQGLIQNPLCHPDDELQEERELRRSLFNALRSFTEAHAPLS